jgi:hypothetical protein
MKKVWAENIKIEARLARENGMSFGELSKKYGVAKSTLHYWLLSVDGSKAAYISRENWIKHIQPMGALANKNKRIEKLRLIDKKTYLEVHSDGHIKQSKKALLAMLYWAEGAKGRGDVVNFANTDPLLSKLFIKLLRESFSLDESKFRVRLHLHHYHNENKVRKFWSDLLSVPEAQFGIIYRKTRGINKIYRKNSAGICFIRYNSLAVKEEIMSYARQLATTLIGPSETK